MLRNWPSVLLQPCQVLTLLRFSLKTHLPAVSNRGKRLQERNRRDKGNLRVSVKKILPLAGLYWEDWRFNEKHTANNSLEAEGGPCSNLDADSLRFFYPSGNVNISKKWSKPTQPIIEFLTELQSSLLIFRKDARSHSETKKLLKTAMFARFSFGQLC